MSALTSLLVRDRVVSVSKIEEALHSQVFQGGDIEVILLEMGLVPEDVLSAYRAALFDLLPATREEVMKARDALRRVPSEMARSLGIVPIFFEGRSLVVAAWEPLYEPRLREVEAQLGCEVSVRIVNQARLASALAHHYGFELEPRLRRLSDALRRRDPGVVPYVRPPSASMRPPAREARRFEVESDNDGEDTEEGDTEVVANPLITPPAVVESPDEPEAPTLEVAPEPVAQLVPPAPEPEPEAVAQPEALAQPAALAEPEAQEETSGLVAVELPEEEPADENVPSGVSSPLAALVRGPITLERAVELLQVASHRDDVLFVLLRYVQQYFDFVCVFSVGKEGLRARMAHGAGLPRDLVESVLIASAAEERGGLLGEAVRSKRAQLGVLGSAPSEVSAASLLQREPGRSGLAVPIELNQRVVLLVYADRVHAGLQLEESGLVLAVVPAVVNALRRIILEAKSRSPDGMRPSFLPAPARAPSLPPPPAQPQPRAPEQRPPEELRAEEPTPAHVSSIPPPVPEEALPWGRPSLDVLELTPAAQAAATDQVEVFALASESNDAELAFQELGFDPKHAELDLPSAPLEVSSRVSDAREDETDGLIAQPESETSPFGAELSAVDLDAFERLMRDEAISDLHTIDKSASGQREAGSRDNAQVRERIAGVPRTAPPPPMYEPAAPPPQATNAYRYRGGGGLAQDRARLEPAQPSTAEARRDDVESDRHRLSLVEPAVNEPSVIIDMGDSVDDLVASLLQAPPGSEPREIDELLTIGESALPVLMQHFPGPLWVERKRLNRRKVRGRDISAVARAVTAFGDRAAPYLASLLVGGDGERIYYALLVAGELIHPDLIDPVARRVLDRDDALRQLALEVLRSYAVLPQYDVVVRAITDLTERPGKDPRRQRLAVEALGELRDARTLRTLLVRLSDRDEEIVRTAHHALVVLTGQDFGYGNRKWETWVEGWGRAHRVEWLIESLMHPDESVRTIAGEELKLLTQQYFGYHPSLPKRERELTQRKYREWWELEGRLNFNR